MRKRLDSAVEKLDEIGHGIYIAELSAWEGLVSRVGVKPTLATVIDVASLSIGLGVFALTSGTIQILGLILALAGAIGIIRREAA